MRTMIHAAVAHDHAAVVHRGGGGRCAWEDSGTSPQPLTLRVGEVEQHGSEPKWSLIGVVMEVLDVPTGCGVPHRRRAHREAERRVVGTRGQSD